MKTDPKWWEFWNPFSGFWGGCIAGTIMLIVFVLVVMLF